DRATQPVESEVPERFARPALRGISSAEVVAPPAQDGIEVVDDITEIRVAPASRSQLLQTSPDFLHRAPPPGNFPTSADRRALRESARRRTAPPRRSSVHRRPPRL